MPDQSRELKSRAPEISFSGEEAEKSKLLLNMRHDLRTPMHVVKGLASVLAASDPLTPRQREAVTVLASNADRLSGLIDNMIDFLQAAINNMDKGPELAMRADQTPMQKNNKSDETPSVQAGPEEEKTGDKKERILLVEDYAPNTLVATSFLKQLGYDYDVTASGKEALEKFSATRYGAVIMDIQMPGMDGLETARRMRALEKQENIPFTPIIATTGNATDEDWMFCLRAGMNDYLPKPFMMKELENKLLTGSLNAVQELFADQQEAAGALKRTQQEAARNLKTIEEMTATVLDKSQQEAAAALLKEEQAAAGSLLSAQTEGLERLKADEARIIASQYEREHALSWMSGGYSIEGPVHDLSSEDFYITMTEAQKTAALELKDHHDKTAADLKENQMKEAYDLKVSGKLVAAALKAEEREAALKLRDSQTIRAIRKRKGGKI
jgi:CheY-like chemotaxis protein